MKLLLGALAYLSFVFVVVAAVVAGVASLDGSKEAPVLAMETDGSARQPPVNDAVPADPNRVPVWIVPTEKYQYTPVAVGPRPKPTPVIGKAARGAMAKAPPRAKLRLEAQAVASPSAARMTDSRRDNDPFFRD
jgi:hypothetical protein